MRSPLLLLVLFLAVETPLLWGLVLQIDISYRIVLS